MRQEEFKMICTCFFDRCCRVIVYTMTALYGHVKESSQLRVGSHTTICYLVVYIFT